jgi:hypothetical protein
VTAGWKELHNEELRDLRSSPSIIILTKSRTNKWAVHVTRMGRRGTIIGHWWESRGKETTKKTKMKVGG